MPSTDRPDERTGVAAGLLFHAVVPAAGRGERFGAAKQFAPVAGRPLLAWTVRRLREAGAASVTLVLPAGELEDAVRRIAAGPEVICVAGGETRQASVALGVAASPAAAEELVAVHDGARAAVAVEDVVATVAAARRAGGAILGRPVTDTIKEVEAGLVVRTVDRSRLLRAETPQVFRRATLEAALAAARRDGFVGTDEASLVERLGGVGIVAVAARRPNPKVTFAEDVEAVARLLAADGEWR